MSVLRSISFLILAGFTITSCHQTRGNADNYFHKGFLNDNEFQCIITVEPDKDAPGLVKRRESALKKARLQLKDKAAESLADYYLNTLYKSKPGAGQKLFQENKETLTNSFKNFASKGVLVMQYYNEDDSVIAVYRIKIRNLKNKINIIASDALR